MIEVAEFARQKGVSVERALEMVHDGRYYGKEVDGIWYIDPRRIRQSSRQIIHADEPAPPPGGSGGVSVPLILLAVAGLVIGAGGALINWPDPQSFIWMAGGFVASVVFGALGLRARKD